MQSKTLEISSGLDFNERIIQKQAKIISDHKSVTDALEKRILQLESDLRNANRTAKIYDDLQKQILENPILQSEWTRFLAFLKMAGDDEYLDENNAHTKYD